MSLFGGDLTTPARAAVWFGNAPTLPSPIISQLIGSMTALVYNKLNRTRLFSRTFKRTFDGLGSMQIMLPDYPVTSILALQQGNELITASPLVVPGTATVSPGYGFRFVTWNGELPGDPTMLDFIGSSFCNGAQNLQVTYQAGYLIANELQIVPLTAPYVVTVLQPQGIWCRDNGMTYAIAPMATLIPVAAFSGSPIGTYIPPSDTEPGTYTFSVADAGASVLISYSFIPADLEEACIQMIAERYAYRTRVGEISKSLGGQETMRFQRGAVGWPYSRTSALPPEVLDLIMPYVSVLPPALGAPV